MTPADLYEMRKVMAAAALLQRGDFDAELERMDEKAKQSVDAASAEATRIRNEADKYLDTVQTKCSALMDQVNQGKTELAADRQKFADDQAAAETQAEENYTKLRQDQQALATDKAALEARAAEIEPRLAEIARKEANLEAAQNRTDALATELTNKLTRIREASA